MKRWQDPSWVEEMRLELDVNLMMTPPLASAAGIAAADLERLAPRLADIQQELEDDREQGRIPFLTTPYQPALVQEIKQYVRGVKGWVENFVVLGSGGSARGAQALQAALNHPYYNLLSRTMRKGFPRLFVADAIDPDGFNALLELVDLRKTLFNLVGNSGNSAENMSQYLIVRDLLKRRGGNRKEGEHLVIITDPETGNLRKITRAEGATVFEIPTLPGGRFSMLSAAGLLPAAMVGVDIEEFLAGAREMDRRCREKNLWKNPAALGAALAFLSCREKNKSLRAFRPYVEALSGIGDWFAQWWAESLGGFAKNPSRPIGTAQQPDFAPGANGAYFRRPQAPEGATDRLLTFVGVKVGAGNLAIPPAVPAFAAIDPGGGHTLNEWLLSAMRATRLALARQGRASLLITLPRLNPFTVGQLLYLLELENCLCIRLLEINPAHRPGDEAEKNLAGALLGRPGYEDHLQGWEPFLNGNPRFVL